MIKADFALNKPIDFVFAGGMMRVNFELPHGLIHVHVYPASAASALWPTFVDPGYRGA
jgi:hypothetical protein